MPVLFCLTPWNSGSARSIILGIQDQIVGLFLGFLFKAIYLDNGSGRSLSGCPMGCYNSWFQSTTRSSNRLIHNLLVTGEYGAAASMGAIALTNVSSDIALSSLLTPKLAQEGMTVGDALLQAKKESVSINRNMPDVILGWTLMGDPTMGISRYEVTMIYRFEQNNSNVYQWFSADGSSEDCG